MVRAALTILAVTVLLAVAPSAASDASRHSQASHPAADETVAELIAALGSDQYADRRRAEEALMRLGPDAVDALKEAEEHADLEISERARYIRQRLRVEWTHPDDDAEVRRALARYGDLSLREKADRIKQLASLPRGEGFGALCRIARLEPSLQTARRAALALLAEPQPSQGPFAEDAAYDRELGDSQRAPVQWIRLHRRETADPQATIADWEAALDAEKQLLAEESTDTNHSIAIDLASWRAERCLQLKLTDQMAAALVRAVELNVDRDPQLVDKSLQWALEWMIENKQWSAFAKLQARFEQPLQASPLLLYLTATAAKTSGVDAEAQHYAELAFNAVGMDADERFGLAYSLANKYGMVDWALREYRRMVDKADVLSLESARARFDLGNWLHDRGENQEAAALLAEFCDALDKDLPKEQALAQQLDVLLAEMKADRHYYEAFDFADRQEYDKQRASLAKALKLNPNNPDILIAMYRSPGADEAYREKTRKLIAEMSQAQLQLVAQDPDDEQFYNQWAWLISNTEGDYAKALAYSKKSLELDPDNPGLLDTLGRCYFAVGDLENAVKAQRRAVELAPQFGVMQRQLKQFEAALVSNND